MTKVFHAVELKSVEVDVVTNFIKDKIENISNAEVYTEIYKVWGQNKNSLNWLFLFYKKTYKSYYIRKPSELIVLNVKMLIQTLSSISMEKLNYMTKSLLKIAFVSVNTLIFLFSFSF